MPTSIRLDPPAERLLRRLAKERGQTKSDLIREALGLLAQEAERIRRGRGGETAYDRVAHVAGIADSGGAALSERTGARFRALLLERARARRSG